MYVRGSPSWYFNINIGDAFFAQGINLLPEPMITKLLALGNIEIRRTKRVIISNDIRNQQTKFGVSAESGLLHYEIRGIIDTKLDSVCDISRIWMDVMI